MKNLYLILALAIGSATAVECVAQDSYLREDSSAPVCSMNGGDEHACTSIELSMFWNSRPIIYSYLQPFGDPSEWYPQEYFEAMREWIDYVDSEQAPELTCRIVAFKANTYEIYWNPHGVVMLPCEGIHRGITQEQADEFRKNAVRD